MSVELTGVAVQLPGGKWGIETTPEEFKRVLGQERYDSEKNFRADYGSFSEPWVVTPDDILKYLGFDDARPVVRLSMSIVDNPELDRQEGIVRRLAQKKYAPSAEIVGGREHDGKYTFYIWIPDVERSLGVTLAEDEASLIETEPFC